MDLASQLGVLERALTRLGIRVLEEDLPDEAQIDGGLCRVADQLVLYVAPGATYRTNWSATLQRPPSI